MFRFRQWLLCATLGLGLKLGAAPPLTTIQDVLFNSDGSRFNGVLTISWQSFEASDTTNIGASTDRLQITNGILYVQLVPTTNADTPAIYTVQYNSSGSTMYTEAWAVPPSSTSLRVRDVRLAPGTVTGSAPTPSSPPGTGSNGTSTPPANSTALQITDITGLQNALNIRPTQGTAFAIARAAVIDSVGAIDGATGNLADCVHVDGTSGPCGSVSGGGGAGTFVDAEFPSGTLDGVNAHFTLANTPVPASSLQMFRNGLLLKQGNDYTVSGNTLTFLAGAIPQPADVLLGSYRISVALSGIGFVDMETPSGTLNGSNTSFTLSQIPSPASSLDVFRNGIRLTSGLDYTLSNNTLTFLSADIPQTGDVLLCSYRVSQ
ncbi:MAG TPA: hypothetical protein VKX49_12240 [Bryobacteraceae bacterium]|nr:hypothetical protein [Bryobacteraceae bacterium]